MLIHRALSLILLCGPVVLAATGDQTGSVRSTTDAIAVESPSKPGSGVAAARSTR